MTARMMVVATAAMYLALCGCKATPPNKAEKTVASFTKHHITVGNRKQKNPLQATPASIADGKEAFTHYCVACHGMDGQNSGVPFADQMSPPIPSLASDDVQRYTDGQLKWVIDYGIWPSGMPASKGTLSDDEIWAIVIYLRHLPSAGSQGEPEMYTH
jgi:mono/diheme cytochrome c family protein